MIETIVVVGAVALLAGVSMPAVKSLLNSFEQQSSPQAMISSALATGRAIAAREQKYAGVRFQQDARGDQYMIFIIHDYDATKIVTGFRAVDGVAPIKLPETIGVMDRFERSDTIDARVNDFQAIQEAHLDDNNAGNMAPVYGGKDINIFVNDTTAFSVIFSPGGNLALREVTISKKDNFYSSGSDDMVFNTRNNVVNKQIGMFVQDNYPGDGLGDEISRNSFVIYEKNKFNNMNDGQRHDYLMSLKPIQINPYSGSIIGE